jgi:hypothetical protein
VKLEQVIGDCDWTALSYAECQAGMRQCDRPTASKTITSYHILGNGLGYSFEDHGKLLFPFGDTISEDQTNLNYHAADPIAWSTTTSDGMPGNWQKYYQGSWSEPGIGGRADTIVTTGPGTGLWIRPFTFIQAR